MAAVKPLPGNRPLPQTRAGKGPPEVRRGWCHPPPVRSLAEQLLAQQLWCWGCDIRREGGNLLLEYGFSRRRPSQVNDGSSCYRSDDDCRHICLWGFGVFYGERRHGGLYLGRSGFQPSWSAVESLADGIHWADELPAFGRPRGAAQWQAAHLLCRRMLQWIAAYERWVVAHCGIEYRRGCVASWLSPLVKAEQMPRAWSQLSRRCWERGNGHWRRVKRQWLIQCHRGEAKPS